MKKWKQLLCGVMVGILSAQVTAGAAADLDAKYEIETNEITSWPQAADIMADTGVLMEASTGAILFDKGANEIRYPASITKLMTLLVAAENGNLEDKVTFTETGIRDVKPDSGNIGMQLGEVLTLEQCLYAMILYSANEVSAQIAEFVGGTEAAFIEMMNEKAEELGCKNTHFTNASGLPDPDQYTTARDMAQIFRAGLRNKVFRKVVKTRTFKIPKTNKNDQERFLATHHPLLSEQSGIFDPDCIGGKSGMTNDAGHTLVTGMKKNGMTLIAVVLRDVDINQAGVDSRELFNYGYENFQKAEVDGGSVVVPKGTDVKTLSVRENPVGENKIRRRYFLNDRYVGRGTIERALPTAEPTKTPDTEKEEGEGDAAESAQGETVKVQEEEQEKGLSQTAKILLLVMGVMALILVVLCNMLIIKKQKKNRRHRR